MSSLPRCRNKACQQRISFFGSPYTGKPRAFETTPVDPRAFNGVAFPVLSGRAYRFTELVDQLQVQRECSRDDAENEVRDMPWYVLHDCQGGDD